MKYYEYLWVGYVTVKMWLLVQTSSRDTAQDLGDSQASSQSQKSQKSRKETPPPRSPVPKPKASSCTVGNAWKMHRRWWKYVEVCLECSIQMERVAQQLRQSKDNYLEMAWRIMCAVSIVLSKTVSDCTRTKGRDMMNWNDFTLGKMQRHRVILNRRAGIFAITLCCFTQRTGMCQKFDTSELGLVGLDGVGGLSLHPCFLSYKCWNSSHFLISFQISGFSGGPSEALA